MAEEGGEGAAEEVMAAASASARPPGALSSAAGALCLGPAASGLALPLPAPVHPERQSTPGEDSFQSPRSDLPRGGDALQGGAANIGAEVATHLADGFSTPPRAQGTGTFLWSPRSGDVARPGEVAPVPSQAVTPPHRLYGGSDDLDFVGLFRFDAGAARQAMQAAVVAHAARYSDDALQDVLPEDAAQQHAMACSAGAVDSLAPELAAHQDPTTSVASRSIAPGAATDIPEGESICWIRQEELQETDAIAWP